MRKLSSAYRYTMANSNPFWVCAAYSAACVRDYAAPDICLCFHILLSLHLFVITSAWAEWMRIFNFFFVSFFPSCYQYWQTLWHSFKDAYITSCTHFNKGNMAVCVRVNFLESIFFSFRFIRAEFAQATLRYCSNARHSVHGLMVWV